MMFFRVQNEVENIKQKFSAKDLEGPICVKKMEKLLWMTDVDNDKDY